MKTERLRNGFMPWAGLALGTVGYFLSHQIGSDAAFQDCRVGSPWIVLLGTLIALGVIGLGARGSWRVYGGDGETPARRMLAVVSMMACGVFAMAVILPFIASLVIPRCWQ